MKLTLDLLRTADSPEKIAFRKRLLGPRRYCISELRRRSRDSATSGIHTFLRSGWGSCGQMVRAHGAAGAEPSATRDSSSSWSGSSSSSSSSPSFSGAAAHSAARRVGRRGIAEAAMAAASPRRGSAARVAAAGAWGRVVAGGGVGGGW